MDRLFTSLLLLVLLTSLSSGKLHRMRHVAHKHRHTHRLTPFHRSHASPKILSASGQLQKKDTTGKTRHIIGRWELPSRLYPILKNFFDSPQLQIKDGSWNVRHVIDRWAPQNRLYLTSEKLLDSDQVEKKDIRWKSRHVIGRWKVLNDSVLYKYMEKFSLDSKLGKLYGGLRDKVSNNFTLKSNGTHFNLGIAENNSSSDKNLLEIKDGYININSTLNKNVNKSARQVNEDFLVMNEKNITLHTSVGKWLKSIGLADRNSQLIWHIRKEDVPTEQKRFPYETCQLKECLSIKDSNSTVKKNTTKANTHPPTNTNSRLNRTHVKSNVSKSAFQSNDLASKKNNTESNFHVLSGNDSIKFKSPLSVELNNTKTNYPIVELINGVSAKPNVDIDLYTKVKSKSEKGKVENEDLGSSDNNNSEMSKFPKNYRNASGDNIHSTEKDDNPNLNRDNGKFNISSEIDVELGPVDDSSVLKTYDGKPHNTSNFRMTKNQPKKFAVLYTESNSPLNSYSNDEGSGSINVKSTSKAENEQLQNNVTNNNHKIIRLDEHDYLAYSLINLAVNTSKNHFQKNNMSKTEASRYKSHSSGAEVNVHENYMVKTEGNMQENQMVKQQLNEHKHHMTKIEAKARGNLIVKMEPNDHTDKTESNEHKSPVAKEKADEHENLMVKTEEEFDAGSTDENPDVPFDVSKFSKESIDSNSSTNSSVLKAMIVEQLKSIEKAKDLSANENESDITNNGSDTIKTNVNNKKHKLMDSTSQTDKEKQTTTLQTDNEEHIMTATLKNDNEDKEDSIFTNKNMLNSTSRIDKENQLNSASQIINEIQATSTSQKHEKQLTSKSRTGKGNQAISPLQKLREQQLYSVIVQTGKETQITSQLDNPEQTNATLQIPNDRQLNYTSQAGNNRKQWTSTSQENQRTPISQNDNESQVHSTTLPDSGKRTNSTSHTDNKEQLNSILQTYNEEQNSTLQLGNENQISSTLQKDNEEQLNSASLPNKKIIFSTSRPDNEEQTSSTVQKDSEKQLCSTSHPDNEKRLFSTSQLDGENQSTFTSGTENERKLNIGSVSDKETQITTSSIYNKKKGTPLLQTDNGKQTTSTDNKKEITSTSPTYNGKQPTSIPQKDDKKQMTFSSQTENDEQLISQLKSINNISKVDIHEDSSYPNDDDSSLETESDESNIFVENANKNATQGSNNSATNSGDASDANIDYTENTDARRLNISYSINNSKKRSDSGEGGAFNETNFTNKSKFDELSPKKNTSISNIDADGHTTALSVKNNSQIVESSQENPTTIELRKWMTNIDKINKNTNEDSFNLNHMYRNNLSNLTKNSSTVQENMSMLNLDSSNINTLNIVSSADLYSPAKLHSYEDNKNSVKLSKDRILLFQDTTANDHFQEREHDYGSGANDYTDESAYLKDNDMSAELTHTKTTNLIVNTSSIGKSNAIKDMLVPNFHEVGLGAKEDKSSSPPGSAGGKPPTANKEQRQNENEDSIPKLIDIATIDNSFCTMAKKLTVKYRSINNSIETIDCGANYNYSNIFDSPPDITLDRANINGIYTLLMLDADAPSPFYPVARCIVHWMVVNIIEADMGRGTEVIRYKKPNPPTTTGPHRYVFLLLKQKEIEPIESFHINDCNLDVNEFAAKHNITYIEGFKYFTTQSKIDYLVLTQHHL